MGSIKKISFKNEINFVPEHKGLMKTQYVRLTRLQCGNNMNKTFVD